MTTPTWRKWYAEHRETPPGTGPALRSNDVSVANGLIIDKHDDPRETAQRLLAMFGETWCEQLRESFVDLTWK